MTIMYDQYQQLDLCKDLMFEYHTGQTRFDGVTPYSEHPLAVAENFDDVVLICASYLHDVIEDCDVDVAELLIRGVDGEIVKLVALLTHEKDQPYDEYINQVCTDKLAVKIKIADMLVNLADDPTKTQKKKYQVYAQQLFKNL